MANIALSALPTLTLTMVVGVDESNAAGKRAVATVGWTGAYGDLTGLPTLGTAAAQNTGFFATAAQGTLAGTAVQPAGLSSALANYTDTATLTPLLAAKAPLASPVLTGTPQAPTATLGTNTTQLATTAYTVAEINGRVATALASYTDTATLTTLLAAKAPLASPTFTGVPVVPTAAGGTNTTQAASTAFVTAALVAKAPLASPALTGTPTAPTAAAGNNSTQIATTAYVDASAPGVVLVSKQTAAASSSLIFPLSSTYDDFEFILDHLRPSTDGDLLVVTFSVDGGTTYLSSGYSNGGATNTITPSNGARINFNDFSGTLGVNNATGVSGRFTMFGVNDAQEKFIAGQGGLRAGGGTNMNAGIIAGVNSTTSAITHVKFNYSTNTIAAGTVKMFGIKKS